MKRHHRPKRDSLKRLFDAVKNEHIWTGWSSTPKAIDQIIYEDLAKLVARCREQYANNGYVKRFVNLCQTNIVGEQGIMVQSKVLDRRGEQDLPVQRVVEQSWTDFRHGVDPAESCSGVELEEQVIQSCAIDGEAFVLRKIGAQYRYGVAFVLIDPVLCDPTHHDIRKNIVSGIEYDSDNRPVAYHFVNHETRHNGYINKKDFVRIPADEIIHVYLPEWAGQRRGLPWIATALPGLKMLDSFEEAALVAARVGASKMGFFTSDGGGEYTGESDDDGNLVMDVEPGSFEQLPQGVKLDTWNPNYPSDVYGDFISAASRRLSASMGVAHHSLTGDMSQVNYTQGRTALLDERDMWKRRQTWLINRLTRKMYESFLLYAIDFGRIGFNGKPLREPPQHYFPASYQGRRWQWVDPLKDATAIEKMISMKLKSLSSAIRETGADPETVWEEINREQQMLESLNIIVNNSDNSLEVPDALEN